MNGCLNVIFWYLPLEPERSDQRKMIGWITSVKAAAVQHSVLYNKIVTDKNIVDGFAVFSAFKPMIGVVDLFALDTFINIGQMNIRIAMEVVRQNPNRLAVRPGIHVPH